MNLDATCSSTLSATGESSKSVGIDHRLTAEPVNDCNTVRCETELNTALLRRQRALWQIMVWSVTMLCHFTREMSQDHFKTKPTNYGNILRHEVIDIRLESTSRRASVKQWRTKSNSLKHTAVTSKTVVEILFTVSSISILFASKHMPELQNIILRFAVYLQFTRRYTARLYNTSLRMKV